jgi:pimeloyl-ACP methyl ester carboxylesterase
MTHSENEEVDSKLQAIQSKISGVVFDSSPAYYTPGDMSALFAALQHSSWRERIGAYVQLLLHMPVLGRSELEQRATNYFESMRHDPFDIPQLYLFSKDDPLSQHDRIEELARHRQHLFGRERILLQQWESSPHCGHFLKHPVEYESAISTFVDLCLHGDTPQSRL